MKRSRFTEEQIIAVLQEAPKKYGDRIEFTQSEDPLVQLLEEMRTESKRLGPPEVQ